MRLAHVPFRIDRDDEKVMPELIGKVRKSAFPEAAVIVEFNDGVHFARHTTTRFGVADQAHLMKSLRVAHPELNRDAFQSGLISRGRSDLDGWRRPLFNRTVGVEVGMHRQEFGSAGGQRIPTWAI